MKRSVGALGAVLVVCGVCLSPAATKEEVVKKLSEKKPSAKCEVILKVRSTGDGEAKTAMEAAGTAWAKDSGLMKVQMQATAEGKTHEIEYVLDGSAFWMRLDRGVALKCDLSALPEEWRKMLSTAGGQNLTPSAQSVELVTMEEKERDGTKYYVLDITKAGIALFKESPFFVLMKGREADHPAKLVKRIQLWVDAERMEPARFELAGGEGTREGELILDFKNWDYADLPKDLFVMKVPEGAEVQDITEVVKRMMEMVAQMKRMQAQEKGAL